MSKTKISPVWEDLTFANNFLFCRIMETEPELCRRILELLLHIKIKKLSQPQTEHTMEESLGSKGVRFDVYTGDGSRIFDIEIQTTNKVNLPRRARYYQSIIDVDNLSRGQSYSQLKDSYIIFLCLEDPMKKGLPVYFFENTCHIDAGLKLDDGSYKVFFNASEYGKMENEDEKNFFKFLAGQKAENELAKSIEEKVVFAKRNMKWRKQYMTWQQTIDEEKEIAFEEGRTEGIEEGRAEGIEEGRNTAKFETAQNLIKMNMGTYEQIAQALNISVEDVEKIAGNGIK